MAGNEQASQCLSSPDRFCTLHARTSNFPSASRIVYSLYKVATNRDCWCDFGPFSSLQICRGEYILIAGAYLSLHSPRTISSCQHNETTAGVVVCAASASVDVRKTCGAIHSAEKEQRCGAWRGNGSGIWGDTRQHPVWFSTRRAESGFTKL